MLCMCGGDKNAEHFQTYSYLYFIFCTSIFYVSVHTI